MDSASLMQQVHEGMARRKVQLLKEGLRHEDCAHAPDEQCKLCCPPTFVRSNGLDSAPDFFGGTPFRLPYQQETDRIIQAVLGGVVEQRVEAATTKKNEKVQMELLPFEALEDVTGAFQVGVSKYDRNSWRYTGIPYSVCASALLRHFSKWQRGEEADVEDGQKHMAAVAFYALCVLQFERDGRLDLDDRYRRDNG